MRFLESWIELSPIDLVRLLAPAAFLLLATFLPGRRVARITALGLAASVPWMRELAVSPPLTAGWVVLWLAIAWVAGGPASPAHRPLAPIRGKVESGAVGLLLALSLLGLLLAAVARHDFPPDEGRRAAIGVVMVGLGLLHLLLRRHVRRALLAFGGMGLGLQVLDGAARGAQVPIAASGGGAMLLATSLAAALAARVAMSRERHAGTAWVSDAHDLHD